MTKIVLLIFVVGGITYFLFNNRQRRLQRIFDKEFNKQFTIVEMEEGHSPDMFHFGTGSYSIVLKDKNNFEFDGVWASFNNGIEYTPKDTILKLHSQRLADYAKHSEIAKKFNTIAPTIIKTAHVFGMDMKEQMIVFLPKDISQEAEINIYHKMAALTIDLEANQNILYGEVFSVCKQNLSPAEKEHLAKGIDFYWNADYKIEVALKPNPTPEEETEYYLNADNKWVKVSKPNPSLAEGKKADVNKDIIFYKYKNDQWTVKPIAKIENGKLISLEKNN